MDELSELIFLLMEYICNVKQIYNLMKRFICLTLLVLAITSAPAEDKMDHVPGYPADDKTNVYSGYLDLGTPNRSMHYVFVESINGPNNKDPLTLWLNGGPGCSSLLGFIQEIGPYYLEEGIDYTQGDNLTKNEYSWHKHSNLLFLESPAGVGYSYNLNKDEVYNDPNTAQDNLKAVVSFFEKFTQFKTRKFFIAGQSYAGKYIPDLAVQINHFNNAGQSSFKINLESILIGNGIMSFNYLQQSEIYFNIDRSFIDPEIKNIYSSSCKYDPDSAGCRHFKIEYSKSIEQLNPYNIYSYCYYNDSFVQRNEGVKDKESVEGVKPRRKYKSQESILMDLKAKYSKNPTQKKQKFNGAPCAYFDGIFDYFNLNEKPFKAKFDGMKWNGPCAENITYDINPAGSMESYKYLLSLMLTDQKITVLLYNGNWDTVVPYHDTIQGIRDLNLVESYTYNPWFTNDQHSGFEQLYSGILFVIFKGASHQVPQSKRPQAQQLFKNVIDGHKSGDFVYEDVFPGRKTIVTQ